MNSQRLVWLVCWAALALILVWPRMSDLDAFRSPDEKRWIANTNGFMENLSRGDWGNLLRQPHPGITTQWLGALTVRFPDWEIKKMPLVAGQILLVFLTTYIFSLLWGKTAGFLTGLFLAVNPLLFAHMRVYAMDSLLALCLLVSIGFLFLWQEKKSSRYAGYSGFFAAAAVLSKLSGIIIIPFALLFVVAGVLKNKSKKIEILFTGLVWFLGAFVAGLIVILPSLAINPAGVFGDFKEFFLSSNYQDEHRAGNFYYLGTFLFYSTPLQLTGFFVLPFWIWLKRKKYIKKDRFDGSYLIKWLVLFALLFVLQMALGEKKGDRYILPAFLMFDAVAAFIAARFLSKALRVNKFSLSMFVFLVFAISAVWQEAVIIQLHPHVLAYVNPLTKNYLGNRRSGWGEGLDLAAQYLNGKEDAENIKAASYYPNEFAEKFVGKTVPAHQFAESSVDYVVIYRAMLEREPDSWETDAVSTFKQKKPEKIISFNGIEFAWIYRKGSD